MVKLRSKNSENPNIETHGRINRAYLSQHNLHIEGEMHFLNQGKINGFKVRFREIELYKEHSPIDGMKSKKFSLNFSLEHLPARTYTLLKQSLKNPDSFFQKMKKKVKKGFAYLSPKLFERVYSKAIQSENPLLSVIPLINEKEGYGIHRLFNVLAPQPLAKEVYHIGGGDILEVSSEFLSIMINYGGLKKTDNILDVGCGLGRMAYSLAYYLDSKALYHGFDVMPLLITRAQKYISPYFPNFHFRHANIWNSYYNPLGTVKSRSFIFPYPNNIFNFCLLTSVFTHMLTNDMEHYLSEIHRVLSPQGTCLFTCFLMTQETKELIKMGKSSQNLIHLFEKDCFVSDPNIPELALGYERTTLLHFIEKAGFKLKFICKGSWCGRKDYLTYQDVVVVSKN